MTDWRKLAMAALLADGSVGGREVKVLKKELYKDKRLTHEELRFLVDLRNAARKKSKAQGLLPEFHKFFLKAFDDGLLGNDYISPEEAKILEEAVFVDKKVGSGEKKLVAKLKAAAKTTSPEFDALCAKVMAAK